MDERDLSDLLVGKVVHLNTFICFVENDWTVTACNDSFSVLVSLNLSHLGMNSTDVADLGSPERARMLHIEIFVALAHLITVRVAIFNVQTRFYVDLEVKEW